jgi:uncharacterized membrane protein YphA (DoxX/SURF4 family)
MGNLSDIGRIFYGISIAGIGLQAIHYRDFPCIFPLSEHFSMQGRAILVFIFGILFILAGACILFEKKTRQVSLLFGGILLLIFCFFYIPYQFLAGSNYMHLEDWRMRQKNYAVISLTRARLARGCKKNQ